MKVRTRCGLVATSLLLAALTTLSGCASTGMQRSEKTGVTMKAVEHDIQQASAQVDVVAASLQELLRPEQPESKKAYNNYASDVAKMENLGKTLFEHLDKMGARGEKYFDEWEKQGDTYKNPEIAALSAQRRGEMTAVYAKIAEAGVGVKRAANDYLTDVKEIRTYLSNDLTPKGVQTIAPVAQQAVRDGESLKSAVKPVLHAIQNARAELAHGAAK